MKQILVVAAENSAENYACQVVDEFTSTNSQVRFFGVGGDKLAQKGVDIIIHNKELAIVGIIEVLSSLVKLKRYMNTLVKEALKRKTDAVLLIDYPDFNLRLAKKMKQAGIRVYYYIAPTVWAWRYSRVKTIKKYVDRLFIIFPFEIPIYSKENIPFTYTGHPLLPMIQVTQSREEFRKELNIPQNEILVSLLPGSRKSEVGFLLATMLNAMERLSKEYTLHVVLLKADNIDKEFIYKYIGESSMDVHIVEQGNRYNLIGASDIALTTCGTSNLELALLNVPFTAVYRVNSLSYLMGKRFVKIDLYSIVNILAGKEVIKEWIQEDFTVENITNEMHRILKNDDVRKTMRLEFGQIREKLTEEHHPPEIIYNTIINELSGVNT